MNNIVKIKIMMVVNLFSFVINGLRYVFFYILLFLLSFLLIVKRENEKKTSIVQCGLETGSELKKNYLDSKKSIQEDNYLYAFIIRVADPDPVL